MMSGRTPGRQAPPQAAASRQTGWCCRHWGRVACGPDDASGHGPLDVPPHCWPTHYSRRYLIHSASRHTSPQLHHSAGCCRGRATALPVHAQHAPGVSLGGVSALGPCSFSFWAASSAVSPALPAMLSAVMRVPYRAASSGMVIMCCEHRKRCRDALVRRAAVPLVRQTFARMPAHLICCVVSPDCRRRGRRAGCRWPLKDCRVRRHELRSRCLIERPDSRLRDVEVTTAGRLKGWFHCRRGTRRILRRYGCRYIGLLPGRRHRGFVGRQHG